MKLYHGTAAANLGAVRARGLVPRGRFNKRSNWEHTARSRAGHVYLTTAYPLYFALCASGDENALVVEVDTDRLDPRRMYPDEDFLAHVLAQQAVASKALHRPVLNKLTQTVNLEANRDLWGKSLELLGTCSYFGHVPPAAITRYATVDVMARPSLAMLCVDPTITLANYRFCGWKYRQLVAWIFGDAPDLPGAVPPEHMAQLGELPGMAEAAAALAAESVDRRGVAVLLP